MRNKKQRLPLIAELLATKSIGNQKELLSELAIRGCNITQATLSRDLRTLKVSKIADKLGGYRYELGNNSRFVVEMKPLPIAVPYSPSIESIRRSDPILIIKLPASQALLLSHSFESLDKMGVLASIPIGDLLMLILEPGLDRQQCLLLLSAVISPDSLSPFIDLI